MKRQIQIACAGGLILGTMGISRAMAQDPIVTAPIIAGEVAPIIASVVKPKPKPTGLVKFEGTVMNANIVQITVKAMGNDMSIQTFPLGQAASAKMQQIIDKGGYQYGDKVKLEYDPQSLRVVKFKGKPSKSL
ncbi:MAG TPA: hypothetical protein VNU20_03800 [Candidatus Sulfotelmatobacter sp.]|jgi:hypothetical protein|nr:hypothetical protein [Candidatus Sulfotelmatobacter sp.]